jgi:peroxiredoxin
MELEGLDMKKKTPSVGEKAPDFQLSTSENKKFKLSSVLKSGKTMLLVFYRGHW